MSVICCRMKLFDINWFIQPSYQPIVAFEVFRQIIQKKELQNVSGIYPIPGPGTCLDYPVHGV